MNKKNFIISVLIILLIFGGTDRNRGAVHKILFMGDSITQGKNCVPGFRDDVYDGLKSLGFPFEFVGSVNETTPYRGFYFSAAYTTDFFEKKGAHYATTELDYWKPTIVVIHLGTNDFWLYYWIAGGPYSDDGGLTFTAHVSGNIAGLLAYLMQWHDGRRSTYLKKIFLCQIIPKTWRHMGPTGIPMLNEDLVRLVDDINHGLVPSIAPGWISLVDQFSTFTNDMFSDDNHPNCYGYKHMGQIFIDAFKTLPMYMNPDSNDDHFALPGHPLPSPISFHVTDGYGNPAPNILVDFSIVWGDATFLSPSTAVSDSNGIVQVNLSLGWADSSIVQAHAPGLVDSLITCTIYPKAHAFLSGKCVYYGNENPVDSVKVRWEDTEQPVYTDHEGGFKIDGVPLFESVRLVPERSIRTDNAIDVPILGAALIARHVVGIQPLTEELQLAADINGDNSVTLQDAVTVARLNVGLESMESTSIGKWKFLPDFIEVDSIETDIDTLCFTAIRIGDFISAQSDVNGDGILFVEEGEEGYLHKDSGFITPIKIPIWMRGENVLACQMTVAWDTSQVMGMDVDQPVSEFRMVYNQTESGKLRLAMYTTEAISGSLPLFTLSFKAKRADSDCHLEIQDVIVNSTVLGNMTTAIQKDIPQKDLSLKRIYPNPFNSQTRISFVLKNPGHVNASIFNIRGQMIRNLINEYRTSGAYQILWDGTNQLGMEVPSGIYLIVFENEHEKYVKRMELLR